MNASELIDAMHKAGATLVVEAGNARVRGTKVPDELLAALKANKSAVLTEWERRRELHRTRHGIVPVGDVLMSGRDVALAADWRAALVAHVFRQPRPVHRWVMLRAQVYHELGVQPDACEACACLDVLAWQLNLDAKQVLEWLKLELS
jgi:hypothetical protein